MNYNYLIKNKSIDMGAAMQTGFVKDANDSNAVIYSHNLMNGLVVIIRLTPNSLDVDVFDSIFKEKYAPFYGGHGGAAIKSEVREIVEQALSKCAQTVNLKMQIMQWLTSTYGTVPETPWEDYPSYYTFKTEHTGKWYALFMDVPAKALSLSGDQMLNVVNVKANPDTVKSAVDKVHVFPAYHMNKKHWLTVLLNATTDVGYLQNLLQNSYALSDAKKGK